MARQALETFMPSAITFRDLVSAWLNLDLCLGQPGTWCCPDSAVGYGSSSRGVEPGACLEQVLAARLWGFLPGFCLPGGSESRPGQLLSSHQPSESTAVMAIWNQRTQGDVSSRCFCISLLDLGQVGLWVL